MEIQTKRCSNFGHREFSLNYDESIIHENDVKMILEYLEQSVAKGIKFKKKETIQFGWMILLIDEYSNKLLSLFEPDMKTFPIKWIRSVTNTLTQTRIQKDTADSLGLINEINFPNILQSAIICNNLGNSNEIFLERCEPNNNDSGWFVGCMDSNHDHNNHLNLIRISLYKILCGYPNLIMYFALPPDTSITIINGIPQGIFYKQKKLEIPKGSFIDMYIANANRHE
jgi:hypothetical protein